MKTHHARVLGGSREAFLEHVECLPSEEERFFFEHVTLGVEGVHEIQEWQQMRSEGPRMCIIRADFITKEAQNALLKTIEEPRENVSILLSVPNPGVLLDTLLSRVDVTILSHEIQEVGAQDFISMSQPERMLFIQKMLEKTDSDDTSAEIRVKVKQFLEELEEVLSKDTYTNVEILSYVLDVKKYLEMPGVSVRTILEALALAL